MKRARRMYRPNLTLSWHWREADSTADVPGLHAIVPRFQWGSAESYQPGDVVTLNGQRLRVAHAGSIKLPSGWRREYRSSRTQRSTK